MSGIYFAGVNGGRMGLSPEKEGIAKAIAIASACLTPIFPPVAIVSVVATAVAHRACEERQSQEQQDV